MTKAADLVVGKKYIITYESGGIGMGELTNSSNRTGTAISGLTFTDGKVDIGGTDVMEMTLGGTTGAWTFLMPDGGYLSKSNANNYFFRTETLGTDGVPRWTITPSSTTTVIRSNYSTTTNYYIRYSSSYNFYVGSGSYVTLYVQGLAPEAPAFSIGGTTVTGSQQVDYGTAITLTGASGTTLCYTTDGTDPYVSSTSVMIDGNTDQIIITEDCTLRAVALDSDANISDEVTLAVTLTPLAVTVNPTSGSAYVGEDIDVTLSANTEGDVVYDATVSPSGATATATSNGFTISATTPGTYTVTFTALDEVNREATATGTYTFTEKPAVKVYEKVTSTSGLTSGDYLIVYESGPYAFDGSLSTLDATSNYKSVTISNNKIETNEDIYFTYDASAGTLKSASGYYIGKTANSNGLDTNTSTKYTNTLSIDDSGNAVVTASGNCTLRFNSDSGQTRFRYYKSVQKAIALYKRKSTEPELTVSPSSLSLDIAAGATSASGTVTVGGSNLTSNVTVNLPDGASGYSLSYNGTTGTSVTLTAAQAMAGAVVTVTYSGTDATSSTTVTVSSSEATAQTVAVNATYTALQIESFNPASGSTFQGATVTGTITANGGTIEWSTDGTTWTTGSTFTATVSEVGGSVTVYARTGSNGVYSDVATATYTREALPTPDAPAFSRQGGEVKAGTTVTITAPAGTTLYVNGTAVSSPYELTITQATTIEAYCVNDEGTRSTTATHSYTIKDVSATVFFKVTKADQIAEGNEYIIVHEDTDTPNALNKYPATKGGTGADVQWADDDAIDIDGTDAIVFQLSGTASAAKFYYESNGSTIYLGRSGNNLENSELEWTLSESNGGYILTNETYSLRYNTGMTGDDKFRCYGNATGDPVYLYYKIPTVRCAAPVIEPGTGTYYESQTVTMTCETEGAKIYYTTDGSEPNGASTEYTGAFTAQFSAGESMTIKAVAEDAQGNLSEVTTVVYTWSMPTVVIAPDTRSTTAASMSVTLTGSPAGAVIYYTTDGSEPSAANGTQYSGAFTVDLPEIGDAVTVKAVAVYNGVAGATATATYTRVESVVEVKAPFFSPMANYTYYGDQTLQMGCVTPGADIYYVIEQVDGTTPPTTVADPTTASTYYDGSTINMTVGHSYRVKAIAYVGNYVSTISEAWYTVLPYSTSGYYYTNLKDFNTNCPTNVTAHFVNPVQVVYHSTYTNNGKFAEFCVVRDNTDYACVYFGKRDTNSNTIFKMGDWIDGSQIAGVTNIWENNFHIQLGTSAHKVTSWPSATLGWSEIIPEKTDCATIYGGDKEGDNLWGHYVHLRYSTLSNVHDNSTDDPKHSGDITDQSGTALNYYDKFYRWSAGTCKYSGYEDKIQCIADYDQDFFTAKQDAGATFDVFGIVDWYISSGFQIEPIDFLWVYKPVISLAEGTYVTQQVATISVTQPEWAAEGVVIYYKTSDMDDWAVYSPGQQIIVNHDMELQAYAEVPATKTDGTTYNDMVRSVTVDAIYLFEGVEDPTIDPESQVIEKVTGDEKVTVTVMDNNTDDAAVTVYTTDGSDPRTSNTRIVLDEIVEFDVNETTMVTAVSYLVSGNDTIWSNVVSETYTFVKSNGVEYELLKADPVEGHVYVIVNKEAYMGMSVQQNAQNRGSVGVKFVDDTKEKVYGNDELAQFVLEKTTNGRYYFKNINGDNAGYLVVTTNAAANLGTASAAGSNAEAAVAVENGNGYPATVSWRYDGVTRYLRYYAAGRTFSTYTDGSLNKEVYLYGLEATPLAYIEGNSREGDQVTVSDQLIGAWAVNTTVDGKAVKWLWAKDQGDMSIDKRPARQASQRDYVRKTEKKAALDYQLIDWDESNWVILDFAEVNADPEEFVGHKIGSASVIGQYVDSKDFKIVLKQDPTLVSSEKDAPEYCGWYGGIREDEFGDRYNYKDGELVRAYNTYVPVNFMPAYWNSTVDGKVVGPVAGDDALKNFRGDSLYFINPKVMEIVRVWGVWTGNDTFTMYKMAAPGEDNGNQTINGWNLKGAVDVVWDYNRTSQDTYGKPTDLKTTDDDGNDAAYEFHAAVFHHVSKGASLKAHVADDAASSEAFTLYPLDLSSASTPTAVVEVNGGKTVTGVSYYNLMGVESKTPFDGLNIVVTRYSDGSASAVKVLR